MLVMSLMASGVFLGCAAFGVDTARWYVEMQRVQSAADAAALAGVPYLPYDMPNATAKAKEVAKRNGFDDAAANVEVVVTKGTLGSQLKVTISSTIENQFGQMIGVPLKRVTRSAVADYKGPAPMGSPCNTFGNEPAAGAGASSPQPRTGDANPSARGPSPFPNCSTTPQLWAQIEGPQTDKGYGDRYQNIKCVSTGTEGCSGGTNDEYLPQGYFWVIRVEPGAVDQPIDLQLYDPAYVSTGQTCDDLPTSGQVNSNNMNPYVTTDGKTRYSEDSTSAFATMAPYCNGDFLHQSSSPVTTTFVVRQQHDSLDPMQGAVQTDNSGQPCIKQYKGHTTDMNSSSYVNGALRNNSGNNNYNQHLAKVFHNWVSMCTFTPTRAGDYYLQVRSNVSAGGTAEPNTNGKAAIIFGGTSAASNPTGNTTVGAGVNSFAIRAKTAPGLEKQVAVSGYDRMPMFANVAGTSTIFNLIRVLPGAAGQYISFALFDVADIVPTSTASGTVTVLPPTDATGSITSTPFPNGGCRAEGAGAGAGVTLTNCSAPVSNTANNGKVEKIIIPIPGDYDCNYASLGGCWYRVEVKFPTATAVNDITTWDANIEGDPVRLIE